MYHTVPPQSDCVTTWREAVRTVDALPRHEGNNVIMAIENPSEGLDKTDVRVELVDEFLKGYDKSIQTISNTIFPEGLYRRHGAPEFFKRFHENVLPSVRRNGRWSGYYFERMTSWPGSPGDNPLWDIVTRLRDPSVKARNKFELALFDPARDLDRSPYGGQCLSFLSFKLLPGSPKTLTLTALYRNHYYVEKLLGNLIGLSRLLAFVAREADVKLGTLTVISSHAEIDLPELNKTIRAKRPDVTALLQRVDDVS